MKKFRVGETARASTTLGEVNGTNLVLLMPGAASDVAAGSGQKGWTEYSVGGSLTVTEKAIGFEGFRMDAAGNQQPVRVFFWKVVLTLTGDIVFGRNEQMTLGMAIEALEDQGKTVGQRLMKVHIITAPAT